MRTDVSKKVPKDERDIHEVSNKSLVEDDESQRLTASMRSSLCRATAITTLSQPGAVAVMGPRFGRMNELAAPSDDDGDDSTSNHDEPAGSSSSSNHHDNATSDGLVEAEPFDLEAHEEKLRRRLEQQAPTAMLVEPSNEESSTPRKRCTMATLLLLFCSLPIALAVIVMSVRDDADENKKAFLESPSNEFCTSATVIQPGMATMSQDTTLASLAFRRANTTGFSSSNIVGPCLAVDTTDTYGVWFRVKGIGSLLQASTCSTTSNFDTRLSVFTGTCEALNCVVANDDFCGQHSSVTWWADENVDYLIFVHGIEQGTFGFNLAAADSSSCEFAQGPLLLKNMSVTVRDSFAGGASWEQRWADDCVGVPVSVDRRSAWYWIKGTGRGLVARTCRSENDNINELPETGNSTRSLAESSGLAIVPGSCNMAIEQCYFSNCGGQSRVAWATIENQIYYIAVLNTDGESDSFDLTISELRTPLNDQCTDAEELFVDAPPVLGTIVNATLEPLNFCGEGFAEERGVWYRVQGNGQVLHVAVTTTSDDSNHMSLNVYRDDSSVSCRDALSELQCVGVKRDSNGLLFRTEADNQTYLILVYSKTESPTNPAGIIDSSFRVSVRSAMAAENDLCATAAGPLSLDGSFVIGSTRNATRDNIDACYSFSVYGSTPGLWYSVIGTGRPIRASTCNDKTNFDTAIAVLHGSCGEFECVAANNNGQGSRCGIQSETSWFSSVGQIYYLFVHGVRDNALGTFALSVEEFKVVENDECSGAIVVNVDEATIFTGSTTDALPDASFRDAKSICGQNVKQLGAGVWHYFVGTGSTLVVRVCPELGGSGSLNLAVFSGDCNNLVCVDPELIAPDCVYGTSFAFDSIAGEVYYAFVYDRRGNDGGSYDFSVGPFLPNSFCTVGAIDPLVIGGGSVNGTTLRSVDDGTTLMRVCDYEEAGLHIYGVWYSVMGNGGQLTASTCESPGVVSVSIGILRSDTPSPASAACGSLTCGIWNRLSCEDALARTRAVWQSEENVLYFIYVFSVYGSTGFKLRVD